MIGHRRLPLALALLLALMIICPTSIAGAGTEQVVLPRYGDVNLDGSISFSDSMLLLKHCNGILFLRSTQFLNADVNCDKSLNTADVVIIIRYVMGLITELPVVATPVASGDELCFTNMTFPTDSSRLSYQKSYSLEGTIVSGMPITNVRVVVYDYVSGNTEIDAKVAFREADGVVSYNTRTSSPSIDSKIRFATLSSGLKRIRLLCSTTTRANVVLYTSIFKIGFTYDELSGNVYVKTGSISAATNALLKYLNSLDIENDIGAKIISEGVKYLGTPYDEMDCSSFVRSAYRDALGIVLPRTSADQGKYCADNNYSIDFADIKTGDILFMSRPSCTCGRYHEIHHSALVLGYVDGVCYLMESSGSSNGVAIRTIWGITPGTDWIIDSAARPY